MSDALSQDCCAPDWQALPASARTLMLEGEGAEVQLVGELSLPTRNVKSLVVRLGCDPVMSTMIPLMPLL